MIEQLHSPLTHPETALFVAAGPLCLTLALVLAIALAGRSPLLGLAGRIALARGGHGGYPVDPALMLGAPVVSASGLLAAAAICFAALLGPLWLVLPRGLGIVAAPLLTLGLLRGLLWYARRRYVSRLERELPAAVGRCAALLANGGSFGPTLERLVADLPEGPLRAEWRWLVERMGQPLAGGGLATPQLAVAALRDQTRSQRHRALLDHLALALGQTHDILAQRMGAAAAALHAAERRQSAAATELAQMKYSGVAVGLAGLAMAAYLAATQWERVALAYGNGVGALAGTLVGAALLAPLLGGVLLARADDLDY